MESRGCSCGRNGPSKMIIPPHGDPTLLIRWSDFFCLTRDSSSLWTIFIDSVVVVVWYGTNYIIHHHYILYIVFFPHNQIKMYKWMNQGGVNNSANTNVKGMIWALLYCINKYIIYSGQSHTAELLNILLNYTCNLNVIYTAGMKIWYFCWINNDLEVPIPNTKKINSPIFKYQIPSKSIRLGIRNTKYQINKWFHFLNADSGLG